MNNERQKLKILAQQHSNEKQELENKIENLKQQIEVLNESKADFIKKIKKLQINLYDIDLEKTELEEDLKIEKQSVIDLENINQYLNTQNKKLVSLLQKKDKELKKVNQRIKDINETNTTLNELIEQTHEQVGKCKQQLQRYKQKQIEALHEKEDILRINNTELKQLQQLIQSQKQQNLKLKEQLQKQKQSFTVLFEKNQHEIKDQILDQNIKESENILREIEDQQNAKLFVQLKKQHDKLQQIYNQLKDNYENIRVSNEELQIQIQLYEQQKQSLKYRIQQLQQNIDSLESVIQQPCQKCKKLTVYKGKYEKLNSILSIKENLIIDLQAEVNTLKAKIDEILFKQILESSCNTQTQEIKQIQDNQTTQLKQKVNQLIQNVLKLEEENLKLISQLSQQKTQRMYLIKKLTQSKQQVSLAIENQTKIKQQLTRVQIAHKQQIAFTIQENQRIMQLEISRVIKQQEQQVNAFLRKTDIQRQAFYKNVAIPKMRQEWQKELQPYINSLLIKEKMKWEQQIGYNKSINP